MLAAIALALTPQALPPSPWTGYSGMPRLSVPVVRVDAVSHSATIEIGDQFADVATVTLFKNLDAQESQATLTVPKGTLAHAEGDGEAKFAVNVLWDNKPLAMRWGLADVLVDGPSGLEIPRHGESTVILKPRSTHSVKTSYRVPVGMAGVDRKQRLVAYLIESTQPVGVVKVSYRYGGRTVFNLPQMAPSDWRWQVGARGAFAQQTNLGPSRTMTSIAYYPGGFDRIGN